MRRTLGSLVRGGVPDAGRWALLVGGFSLTLAASAAAAPAAGTGRGLTFEQRVACRERVEDVYWAHRVWPKENPGPKPPREQVLSRAAIAAQIDESLRYEAALERHWQARLGPRAIQTEIDRQARSSKDPRALRELWLALDNDPFLVGECLVRPELALRRIHERFTEHRSLHGTGEPDFDAWWGRSEPAGNARYRWSGRMCCRRVRCRRPATTTLGRNRRNSLQLPCRAPNSSRCGPGPR